MVTFGAVTCSDGFGFVAFRYRAGTGLSRTMKFSVLVSAASEHRLAVGTWISRGGRNVACDRPRQAGIVPGSPARARLYPKSLMDLGEQELRPQIAHRRTETTVRSGAEWNEGQVRPCRQDVLVVKPRRVVRCGFAQWIRRGDRRR